MTWIIGLLFNNKIARTIGMVVMAVLGILTFGAVKKREGARDAKAKADLRDLKGFKKTTERMQDADAAMGDDPAALRQWLKERAERGRDVR